MRVFRPIRLGGDTARLDDIRRLEDVPPNFMQAGREPRCRGGELLRLAPLLPAIRVLHPHPLSHVALLQPIAGQIGLGQRRRTAPPRDILYPAVHHKTLTRQRHRSDAMALSTALGALVEARAVPRVARTRLVKWVDEGQAVKTRVGVQGSRALRV